MSRSSQRFSSPVADCAGRPSRRRFGRSVRSLLVGLVLVWLVSADATAQTALVLDGSLPNGRMDDLVDTQPGPVYTVDQTMGEARGGNLFHSFQYFSIGAVDTADFTSIQPFENVLVRVTGDQESLLNGTLRSSVLDASGSGADFFLLNPRGIVFGANSQIDVPANLYLSTADELIFADGSVLDLLQPNAPVLSIAEPTAFGFLGATEAAKVAFEDASGAGAFALQAAPGTTLAAVGGEVRTEARLTLSTRGGRLGLVAVGDAAATVDVASLEPSTTTPDQLGRVSIAGRTTLIGVDTLDPDADQGEVFIRGGRFEVLDGRLQFGGNGSTAAPAVDIRTTDLIALDNRSFIALSSGGVERGGDALIAAPDIQIRGAGSVITQSSGAGGGGDLRIEADRLIVESGGQIVTSAEVGGLDSSGPGGDVEIVAGEIRIDGGSIVSRTDAMGPGGDLDLVGDRLDLVDGRIETRGNANAPAGALRLAVEDITITGPSSAVLVEQSDENVASGALELGTGSGSLLVIDSGVVQSQTRSSQPGSLLRIDTGRLEVRDGGRIESSTLAAGVAGAIEIEADSVEVARSAGAATAGLVSSRSAAGASGAGGQIEIVAGELLVADGGQIDASTEGGDAGAIDIDVTGALTLRGDNGAAAPSGLFNRVLTGSTGQGGSIDVEAQTIAVEAGAEVSSKADGAGRAGDIVLRARESVSIVGFGATGSLVSAQGIGGPGGDVHIEAPQLLIADGGGVDVSTRGAETGGRLTIRGGDLTLRGASPDGSLPATLAARAEGIGDADGIEIALSGDLRMEAGGRITTEAEASGEAGDIEISARNLTLSDGAGIRARAAPDSGANAGSIAIDIAEEIRLRDADVTTKAPLALGGDISLRAGRLIAADRSEISADVGQGIGSGGDVTLAAPYVVFDESDLTATAFEGDGGNIQITTEVLVRSASVVIDASSEFALDGEISITAPATDLSGQLANLAPSFLDVASQLRRDCAARTDRAGSFIVQSSPTERRFEADELDLDAPVPDSTGGVPCPPR